MNKRYNNTPNIVNDVKWEKIRVDECFREEWKRFSGPKWKFVFPANVSLCPYSCMTDDCANERTDMCVQLTVYSIHEQLTPVGRCWSGFWGGLPVLYNYFPHWQTSPSRRFSITATYLLWPNQTWTAATICTPRPRPPLMIMIIPVFQFRGNHTHCEVQTQLECI